MEPIFRKYVQQAFRDFVRTRTPEFSEIKERPAEADKGSLAFRSNPGKGVALYLLLQCYESRDRVDVSALWSLDGKFPGYDAFDGQKIYFGRGLGDQRLSLPRTRSGLWLNSGDFGRAQSWWDIEERAPDARLKQAYERPEVKKELLVYGVEDWKTDALSHRWNILAIYDTLTMDDARAATQKCVDEICAFVERHYLPYFREVTPILLERAR